MTETGYRVPLDRDWNLTRSNKVQDKDIITIDSLWNAIHREIEYIIDPDLYSKLNSWYQSTVASISLEVQKILAHLYHGHDHKDIYNWDALYTQKLQNVA